MAAKTSGTAWATGSPATTRCWYVDQSSSAQEASTTLSSISQRMIFSVCPPVGGAEATNPFLHGKITGRLMCPSCSSDPDRSKFRPWIAEASMPFSMVQVMAHWADTSTSCASPVRRMRACATSAAAAASAPVCRHTWGTLTRTGARSGLPCIDTGPPMAAIVRSAAGCCA